MQLFMWRNEPQLYLICGKLILRLRLPFIPPLVCLVSNLYFVRGEYSWEDKCAHGFCSHFWQQEVPAAHIMEQANFQVQLEGCEMKQDVIPGKKKRKKERKYGRSRYFVGKVRLADKWKRNKRKVKR